MSPERYQRIKQLFEQAVALAPGERAAFLRRACPDDDALRTEVQRMLTSDAGGGEFISGPAAVPVASFLQPQPMEKNLAGQRLGHYEILSEIGRGGMGRVYLAARADDQYRKLVAIKLVNPGIQTDLTLMRFLRERQILASLEHPNIAQLLDGGTAPDGRPYLVMEYVGGIPIDEYCDSHKLGLRPRLELFRTVCAAVHHAHQNLIVHRDLKPGNILVKSDGTLKLLDFGIAKLIHADAAGKPVERTATGMRILTPDYASPEQVRGEAITTASDVYTLGVVLYELLAGRKPNTRGAGASPGLEGPELPSESVMRRQAFGESAPEVVAANRSTTPPGLQNALRGDLDAIVTTALQPAAAKRHGSAEKLSEDIQRYLDGKPVWCRPQSTAYLLSKLVRRQRAAAAALVLAAVLLMAGFVAAQRQVSAERSERERIEKQLEEMRREMERLRRGLTR